MNFLLDTNVCSAYLRNDPRVFNRFLQHGGALATSSIVAGELWVWALHHRKQPVFVQALENLLADMTVISYELAEAKRFAEIRAALLAQGQDASAVDLMIAATALVHNLNLVTRNVHHFSRVPDLRVENWQRTRSAHFISSRRAA